MDFISVDLSARLFLAIALYYGLSWVLTRLIWAAVTPPALLAWGSLVRSHRNSGLMAYKLGFQKDVRKAQESTGGEKRKGMMGKKLWDAAGGRATILGVRQVWQGLPGSHIFVLLITSEMGPSTRSQPGFREQAQITAPLGCIR